MNECALEQGQGDEVTEARRKAEEDQQRWTTEKAAYLQQVGGGNGCPSRRLAHQSYVVDICTAAAKPG